MSLTVSDILHLDGLSNFRLEAGIGGLDRVVTAVGMLDYELDEEILKNFSKGEFVVTTLVAIKDSLEHLENMVRFLIESGSSGLAIKTIYLDRLPEVVSKLANAEKYPIFLFSETFFEVIITDVRDALLLQEEGVNLEWQIDQLLSGQLSPYHVRRSVLELNRGFEEMVMVTALKAIDWERNQKLRLPMNAALLIGQKNKLMTYRGRFILMTTALEGETLELQTEDCLRSLGFTADQFARGDSGIHNSLGEMDIALHEALQALEFGQLDNQTHVRFNDLGIGRLLMPLKDLPVTKRYYEQMIQPLLFYDQKNGTDLITTAMAYVDHQADVKGTAAALFQHANTIRYRMDRIKVLMGPSFSDAELSLLMTLHKLYR